MLRLLGAAGLLLLLPHFLPAISMLLCAWGLGAARHNHCSTLINMKHPPPANAVCALAGSMCVFLESARTCLDACLGLDTFRVNGLFVQAGSN